MKELEGKVALVTGAGQGIGQGIAFALADAGVSIMVTGRTQQKLLNTVAEINERGGQALALTCDVKRKEDLERSVSQCIAQYGNLNILVNNAGNAHGLDPIQSGSIADWDAMMDINVKGLLYVSKAILPGMLSRNAGHIINIGSTAGKEVYPKGNVYCASKHAVDAINQGMRLDLNGTGIKVGAINPGLVETEFSEVRFKGNTERAETVYQGYTPLRPEDIADIIWFTVTRPPHVNIADLTVMCLDQASSTIINKN